MIKFYQVGGYVRDKLMGRKSKDIDHAVEAPSFEHMKEEIMNRGGIIYQLKPEFYTIRAMVPGLGDCDFVYCRKEGPYSDGRRPDWVLPGTIQDDLSRRDFTMNAIAIDEYGVYYDPFEGRTDIKQSKIRCVGSAKVKMVEDGLRIIRAIRFAAQLGFEIDAKIVTVLRNPALINEVLSKQKVERIRDELEKGFKANTYAMIQQLVKYHNVSSYIFREFKNLWLLPTLKERK